MALYENKHSVRLKGFWNDPVDCMVTFTDEMIQIRHKKSATKAVLGFLFGGAPALRYALSKLELDIPYSKVGQYKIGRDRLKMAISIDFTDTDGKNKTVVIYGNKSNLEKIAGILDERCNL